MEVPDTSADCPECGFPFESLTPKECPKCKSMVVFSTDLCPACGLPYEELNEGPADGDAITEAVSTSVSDPVSVSVADAVSAGVSGTVSVSVSDGAADTAELDIPDRTDHSADDVAVAAQVDAVPPELTQIQDATDPAPQTPSQPAAPAAPATPIAVGNNPVDNDYVIRSIIGFINDVRIDIINKPIKSFVQILSELDNSNKELHGTVVQESQNTLVGVQETVLAIVSEIAKLTTEQNRETLSKSQELALTIVSEINAATGALKEANSTSAAELSNSIKQIAAKPASTAPEADAAAPNNTNEYILYLCVGMLVFTILNFFITIYAVKLIK